MLFQFNVYDLTGTETESWSIATRSIGTLACIIQPFHEAHLTSVEAVVFPSAASIKIPVTIDLDWTPADVVPGSSLLQTPGAVRLTIGSLCASDNHILPANLHCLNPVIKSHLPCTDSSKLTLGFNPSRDATTEDAPLPASRHLL